MATQNSPYELFGLDLRNLGHQFTQSWRALAQTRLLAWLGPNLPVRLLRADDSTVLWTGSALIASSKGALAAEFDAIEIPENLVLRKWLSMPSLADSAIAQAVELEARAAAPFAPGDLIWGARTVPSGTSGKNLVEMVLVSRRRINQYLDEKQRTREVPSGQQPEVWILASDGSPIVMAGWGEQRRAKKATRQRVIAYALIALAMVLAGLVAITPSLQLRARSLDANSAFEALQRETAQSSAKRESFTRSVDRLDVLQDRKSVV